MNFVNKQLCSFVLTFALVFQLVSNCLPDISLAESAGGNSGSSASVTEQVYTLAWVGNLTSAVGIVNQPTTDIQAEVYIDQVTAGVGQGAPIKAQLGYKSDGADFTWVDAGYAGDTGNNDRYKANFVPAKSGIWTYVMRFSGDSGQTWKLTEEKTVTIADKIVYTIGWTGNLSTVTSTQLINVPTRSIYAEVYINGVTGKADQVAKLKVQLGYKLDSGSTDFLWNDAVYAGITGNNDRYKANFTPDQVGKWNYAMRVSGDGGVTWSSAGTSTLTVVATEGEMTLPSINSVENLTDLTDKLLIDVPTPDILGEVKVEGITDEPGQGRNTKAQLGYKFENDTDYTWVDAVYRDDVGSKDRFKANFTPTKAGTWYYAMRFSLNNGATWESKLLGYKVNRFFDAATIEKPFDVTLTWSESPKTTQTITWKTSLTNLDGVVQYAKKADAGSFPGVSKTANAVATEFKTTNTVTNTNLHTATLRGLEPGTAYVYRVGSGELWSDTNTFTTEALTTTPFSFLVFGDSQSGRQEESDYAKWGETVNTAYKANPGAKFFMNVGDLTELDSSYAHWHKWFEGSKGVIENIPEMPVPGNHEYYAGYNANELANNFIAQFKVPQNGPDRLKGTVYSFDYGDVHIAVLNSQQAEVNQNIPTPMNDILEEQKVWLDKDLQSTTKKWKIALYHKASYYARASRDTDAEPIKLAFQPIFDKYHVDVVFAAHDHAISRTFPINNNYFVDTPGQGTVYYITGRSGNKNYNDPMKQVWDAYQKNDTEDTNYFAVQVNGDKLTIKSLEKNGTLLDEYTIDKVADTGIPYKEMPKIPIAKTENLSSFSEVKAVGTAVTISSEVNAANVTNYKGRGIHIRAQLGYKAEMGTSYTWTDAFYSADKGKNDEYKANFTPVKSGIWKYLMRFSGDAGATWTQTEEKTLNAVGESVPEAPGAPANVTASAGDGQVSLQWSSVTGAVYYSIKRGASSDGPFAVIAANVTSATYTNTGLSNGTTYYYAVTAANAGGVSANSVVVHATPYRSGGASGSGDHSSSTSSNPSIPSQPEPSKNSSTTIDAQPRIEKTGDGKSVAIVTIEGTVLNQALEVLKSSAGSAERRIHVDVKSNEALGKVEIPSASLTELLSKAPAVILSMKYGNATYDLPLQALHISSLAKSLGVSEKDIKISITIEKLSGATAMGIESKAKEKGLKLLTASIDYMVVAEANGKQVPVNDFGTTYISRSLDIGKAIDMKKATAVLYDPATGNMVFVPAVFSMKDGIAQAEIKRPGNSIYAVVENLKTFDDLKGHWSQADVELLASKLVIQGTTESSFAPQKEITRAEFTALLVRALGLSETKAAPFTDVKTNDWFAGAIGAASKAGLADGFDGGAFYPAASITREQMAVMLTRAMKIAGKQVAADTAALTKFSDHSSISGWAKEAVAQSATAGIVNGVTERTFVPSANATRAEAAAMLKRWLQFEQFMN
ncbi:S-layer homology domain-containing protein [Paenibacillus sp. SI8]|uniref:S-layer homology domain-containing protein n=1 Tax=unclassified Paenibacillus TaxID=185978 RepID=UPI0034673A90